MLVADRPTFTQLIVLENPEGHDLRIIKWITKFERSQCEDLAYLLLNDDVQVGNLLKIENNEDFVRKVLREWLALDDGNPNCTAVPRTWEDLAKCVTKCGLDGTLANAIRSTCPQSKKKDLLKKRKLESESWGESHIVHYNEPCIHAQCVHTPVGSVIYQCLLHHGS